MTFWLQESSRPDTFLDMSLDIHEVSSVEEALDKFVTPEILSDSSQWKCSKCDKLVYHANKINI